MKREANRIRRLQMVQHGDYSLANNTKRNHRMNGNMGLATDTL